MSRSLGWYARRLAAMSPREIASRSADKARQARWARHQVRVGDPLPAPASFGALDRRAFTSVLPAEARDEVSPAARAAVVEAARDLLAGHWEVLGTPVPKPMHPDWFLDPLTGRHAPADRYCFRVDQRDESVTGNVKMVWEMSRHHHVTVLAAAYWLTGEERFAENAALQLRSWWVANPFLSGVHWTSGIEIGIRLIAWSWTRRLLDGWSGAADLFERDDDAVRQIWWHQRYLDAFRSGGSSSNNHLVAEAAGRLAAASAFPWYAESSAWRADAARQLADSVAHNTFESGINKELATEYQGFVAELALVAAADAEASGHAMPASFWSLLERTVDATAAITDVAGRPPRQGDGDEGRALVVDDPEAEAWELVLATGGAALGAPTWWPHVSGGVESVVVSALLGRAHDLTDRPAARPDVFADAGMTLLRTPADDDHEMWVRCDGGPHGFLSIAAHGHADALSVEARYDGVEVLVDPGTYCYHGEPAWRSYFRGTLAHNTLEIGGTSQSREGGPFLWTSQARTTVETGADQAAAGVWAARVTGHPVGDDRLSHRRTVRLDAADRTLAITDEVVGGEGHALRLAFHLGPDVTATLDGDVALLSWQHDGKPVTARLLLPGGLTWTAHRGETEPVLGWYSPGFGVKVPTTTLIGSGRSSSRHPMTFETTLAFVRVAEPTALRPAEVVRA